MQPEPQPKKKSGGLIGLIVLISVCVLSVPCIGVVSAIAIPSFIGYLNRAKTAEAESNLRNLYTGAAAYYASESWAGGGPGGGANTNCAVGNGRTTNVPSASNTLLGPLGEPFDSLGFALADPVYYQYEIVGVGGCGHTPGEALYSFRAYGDLDGDGVTSLFEIAASAGADGELVRAPAIYREQELE